MATSKLRQAVRSQKEDLQKRHKEAVDRKDTGRFGSIFIRDKIPSGVKFWKIENGQHLIDIIPFEAGSNMPDKNVPEGTVTYLVELWRHRNVGVNDASYVCNAKTWNLPCAVCEDLSSGDYSDDDYDKYKAKRVCCYLVWVHNDKEEKDGIKILELPYFFLQKHLDELAVSPRGGGVLSFSDVDDGRSVAFTKSGGKTNWSFIGHQFVDREEPIPEEICEQSFSLDECIHMRPTYEEVADAWFGPQSAREEKDDHPQAEKEPEREERKETPQETEDTGSTEPPTAAEIESGVCPAGGVFGQDTDNLDQCTDCEQWDNCFAAKKDSMESPKQEQSGEETGKPRRVARRRASR